MSTVALFLQAAALAKQVDRLKRERDAALALQGKPAVFVNLGELLTAKLSGRSLQASPVADAHHSTALHLSQSTKKEPMTTATITNLDTIGTPYEGGFYGGQIKIKGTIFAIAWAPQETEVTATLLKPRGDVPAATSCYDSMANTTALAAAGSGVAQAALAATINGHTDWCLPARDVLEMGYRYLKPSSRANYVSFRDGDNASSVPVGYPYTKDTPAQTQAEAFRDGGPEAFDKTWYWSSTQSSEGCAFVQNFSDGSQGSRDTYDEGRCRFVRLIQLND